MGKSLAAPIFLQRFIPLIDEGRVSFIPRNVQKSRQFVLKERLETEDVFSVVKNLKPEDVYSGPDADRDGSPGNIMVFTNPYKKILLYIKLKLWEDEQGDHGQVISFHPEGMHERRIS